MKAHALAIMLILPTFAWAERDTIALSGVDHFAITTKFGGYGMTDVLADGLKSKAELEARKVPLTLSEFKGAESLEPHLEIVVDALQGNIDVVACNLRLEFYRAYAILPTMANRKPVQMKNVVWERGVLLMATRDDFNSSVLQAFDTLLPQFLNNFLEANPKMQSDAAAEIGPDSQWIQTDQLAAGSPRHHLSTEQVARITALQSALKAVDDSPIEKWLDDFARDLNPDREIAVWESIAHAYQHFRSTHTITKDAESELLALLVVRSTASEEDALAHSTFKSLTRQQAIEALALFKEPPAPIQVFENHSHQKNENVEQVGGGYGSPAAGSPSPHR